MESKENGFDELGIEPIQLNPSDIDQWIESFLNNPKEEEGEGKFIIKFMELITLFSF